MSSETPNPSTSSDPPLKTYTGGCHCGFLRYSFLAADLATAKFSKCNCSICHKINRLSLSIPRSQLTVLSPTATESGTTDEIPRYKFGSQQMENSFCGKCGIHCFSSGWYEWEGEKVESFSVNAVTLDPDQGVDFREVKIVYWDGKGDNWKAGTADRPYEGGCF